MTLALLQVVLVTAGCYGLWRLWLACSGSGRVRLIVAAGFLIRALLGQALYWISFLRLPIARSLQLGNGFWFFALDGPGYLDYAHTLIEHGPKAMLFIDSGFKSRLYTQAFTFFVAAFGVVGSVAILFNCAAYLATCAIVQRIGPRDPRFNIPRLIALAAITFGPGTILWSLQPLKDTFFLLLIVSMIGACYRWQELWRRGAPPRMWPLVGCGAAMLFVIYEIGGTRWYFATIVLAAWPLFLLMTTLAARPRRLPALLAGTLLFLLLTQAFRLGGSNDMPEQIHLLLTPQLLTNRLKPAAAVPRLIVESREGFEYTRGATMILPGPALPPTPVTIATSEAPSSASGVFSPAGRPVEKATLFQLRVETLVTGFTAMFIPKTLAEVLGLVRIGGGRGFWFFVEVDTLVFDAVMLFTLIFCARALRTYARVTPLFILLLLIFVMTAAPMMYTVANFGTLFRLRQMVYGIAAIMPLTLAPRS
ncbi:MAG: hypothetical protein ACRD3J_19285, partial [Thermoanaerobaculia bacterium]